MRRGEVYLLSPLAGNSSWVDNNHVYILYFLVVEIHAEKR